MNKDEVMNRETEIANNNVFHGRADHEDILHTRRLGLFLTFIAFLAVALGLTSERFIKGMFAFMGVVTSLLWLLWAGNAGVFIRKLRDAGVSRADEQLWRKEIAPREDSGPMGKRLIAPLKILNYWLPGLLVIGWIAILIYIMFFN